MLNKRRLFRNFAKKIYKNRREQDRQIGLKINELIQEIHYEIKQIKDGKIRKDTEEYLRGIGSEIKELKSLKLTKEDFPSFSAFWQYLKSEKISHKDLKELNNP